MTDGDCPRVRRNLRYVQQVLDGRVSWVVKDPLRLQYFRFGEAEVWMMQRMDGTQPLDAIALGLREALGINATAAAIRPFVDKLKQLGLAERTREEQRILLTESLRRDRRLKLKGHGSTLLRMRFPLGDPDRVFERMARWLRFCWTPAFVILSGLAIVAYGAIITANWDAFSAGIRSMYRLSSFSAGTLAMYWIVVAAIIAIHEAGHGLTCKHFGGEVHEVGAMLLYFMPSFYCNVNDAWTFERRGQRLWVTFAGGWIQLVVAFLSAVTWLGTEPETLLHQAAFFSMLFSGGIVLLINFNPLIPLDGYYALMDWLGIPNLRARAFRHLSTVLKRNVMRVDIPATRCTPREARIFIAYGVLSLLYTALLLSSITLLLSRRLVTRFEDWGMVLAAIVVAYLLRKPLGALRRVLRVWWAERGTKGGTRRTLRFAGAGTVLLLLLLVTPWVVTAKGEAMADPPARLFLRPPEWALVTQVRVGEGQHARAGDTIAVLSSPDLELRWTHARAAVEELERQAAAQRSRGQAAETRRLELQLGFRRTELQELERRRDALTLRAPFAAIVVTPHLEERVGEGLARGDSLVQLWADGPPHVRIRLSQRDAGGISAGSLITLRFASAPGRTLRTTVAQLSPAAQAGSVELLAPLPAVAGLPVWPGMVGRAKVVVMHTTAARALLRAVRRTIRVDWWP